MNTAPVVHQAKTPPRHCDDGESSDLDALLGLREDDRDRKRRIRCPKCRWTPSAHDRWQCTCLHIWNTFDKCKQWSNHEDWYEK